jgi:hypothetical protein
MQAPTSYSPIPPRRPLQLESRESRSRLEGDVYAVTDHDFASVATEVTAAASWCEILSLHLNVKRCSATPGSPVSRVVAYVGRKRDEPQDAVYGFEFAHRTDLATPDYIRVVLDADTGPFGTRDHRISSVLHHRWPSNQKPAGRRARNG